MAGNSSLARANREKNDEFYTQLTDIEKELRYYRKHFKGKTIFCNCDDPFESNFFKYFVLNFNRLGLEKLIATCYATSPIANQQLSLFDILGGDESNKDKPYKAVVTKVYDATGDGGIDMLDVAELFKNKENELAELKGDGDFRSEECLELLKEADIVVTNPPFSLFRDYVAQLMEYDKKFLIIGNQNAITYKEIFPLLKDNKMWLGYKAGDMAFTVPDYYEARETRYWKDENGQKWRSLGNICWFTNIDIKKRHEDLILIKKYNPKEYPKYDNYDAIEVSKTKDIPYDYEGVMGVPITFMDKYNPDQFEILGMTKTPICHDNNFEGRRIRTYSNVTQFKNGKEQGNGNKVNDGSAIIVQKPIEGKVYYKTDEIDGVLIAQYPRILIRNKHPEPRKED